MSPITQLWMMFAAIGITFALTMGLVACVYYLFYNNTRPEYNDAHSEVDSEAISVDLLHPPLGANEDGRAHIYHGAMISVPP